MSDVRGRISETTSWKTQKDSTMVIARPTFSPEPEGSQKTAKVMAERMVMGRTILKRKKSGLRRSCM